MTTTDELRTQHAAHVHAQEAERAAMRKQFDIQHSHEDRIRAEILDATHSATPEDYGLWMAAYLALGGQPTHWYGYPQPDSFRVAYVDLDVRPLHGATLLNIIGRRGVSVTGSLGHSTVYLMDEPLRPCRWVPVFSDAVLS